MHLFVAQRRCRLRWFCGDFGLPIWTTSPARGASFTGAAAIAADAVDATASLSILAVYPIIAFYPSYSSVCSS